MISSSCKQPSSTSNGKGNRREVEEFYTVQCYRLVNSVVVGCSKVVGGSPPSITSLTLPKMPALKAGNAFARRLMLRTAMGSGYRLPSRESLDCLSPTPQNSFRPSRIFYLAYGKSLKPFAKF